MEIGRDALATRALEVSERRVRITRFRVVAVGARKGDRSAASQDGEVSIGSDARNRLVLADPTVSRHHCVVTATARGFHLRDLGSTNGTIIGGCRVESALLPPGGTFGVGRTRLRLELAGDVDEEVVEEESFGALVGKSAAMLRMFGVLRRVARSGATLLLEGETGTGKGLVARAVHEASDRAGGPFLVVDCGAIPPSLMEAELFGHQKGAFTGATVARAGVFEAAHGGTVFIDELGELPLDMQPKLLRVLEERVVRRLGAPDVVPIDVRVVAATHRDLRRGVNQGTFRADLYFRLNTVRIEVPALRDRLEDLPLLVAHFHEELTGGEAPPDGLVDLLARHDWPGNVRELRSAVERAVLLPDPAQWKDALVDPPAGAAPRAPAASDPSLSFRAAKEAALTTWERAFVAELLARHGGNISRAAREARMDRNYLKTLLRRYGLLGGEEQG